MRMEAAEIPQNYINKVKKELARAPPPAAASGGGGGGGGGSGGGYYETPAISATSSYQNVAAKVAPAKSVPAKGTGAQPKTDKVPKWKQQHQNFQGE